MTAWKQLELRVAKALGGRRAGPLGAALSDIVGVPWAVECKRSSREGPPVLSQWIKQARAQGKREKRAWLLVVAGHNDRWPTVTLDFTELVVIADAAHLPGPLDVVIKTSSKATPSVRAQWIREARKGKRRDWLLVVVGRDDPPVVALELAEFLRIARLAGLVPTPTLRPYSPGDALQASLYGKDEPPAQEEALF